MHKANDIFSAQFVTRLLIVSYFLAVALNLISGTELWRMADPFMSDQRAHYTMRLVVLALCGMVLFGVWRRPAALVLALVVFWTSYMTLYAGGEISAFWRDLALIGALLLTANITDNFGEVGEHDEDEAHPSVEATLPAKSEPKPPTRRRQSVLFREDFDIVRGD